MFGQVKPSFLVINTVDLQWLEPDGSFTTAVSNSFLSPLEINPMAAGLGLFRVIFILILKMVYYGVFIRIAWMRRF